MYQILEFALTANVPVFVVDSPAFPKVYMLRNSSMHLLPSNEHGYAIWYHIIHSNTSNVMVLSKDTDTWVYGLALMEQGLVSDKNILVKLGVSNDVSINLGVRAIASLPTLSTIRYPVMCIVALYILTGCDYVSSFFRVTKLNVLQCFIQHAEYVCTPKSLLQTTFDGIELSSFARHMYTILNEAPHTVKWLKYR